MADEQREQEPTAVMRRDDLRELVQASAASAVSAHAVPRVLLDHRGKLTTVESEPLEAEDLGTSPWLVLGILGGLVAMFIAIVVTAS